MILKNGGIYFSILNGVLDDEKVAAVNFFGLPGEIGVYIAKSLRSINACTRHVLDLVQFSIGFTIRDGDLRTWIASKKYQYGFRTRVLLYGFIKSQLVDIVYNFPSLICNISECPVIHRDYRDTELFC